MSNTIECYTGFYQEKDQPAVCGIVLVHAGIKNPYFKHMPKGDYLNGLLQLLIERIEQFVPRLNGRVLHLDIHVHHKNSNFKKALEKTITAADTGCGYSGVERGNIIKHTLVRKDYKKPASYERMTQLALLLAETNSPVYRVTLTTCGDSKSRDQLAVYTACQGAWNDMKAVNGPVQAAEQAVSPAN